MQYTNHSRSYSRHYIFSSDDNFL
ncbi:unnamed protein product [Victoria cruziana]